jgi:hypothetical protein
MQDLLSFREVCQELDALHLKLVNRVGDPRDVIREAKGFLSTNADSISPTKENLEHAPILLRSCASILRGDESTSPQIATCLTRFLEEYLDSKPADFNHVATALRATILLTENTVMKSLMGPLANKTYVAAMSLWRTSKGPRHTISMLSLLKGCHAIYGRSYAFTPPFTSGPRSLLPIKCRLQMEAQMNKCFESRQLLNALLGMRLTKYDAGMCLSVMEEAGFYHEDLAKKCCDVLACYRSSISSNQWAQVVHSLGVLQHRSEHQRLFSGSFNAKNSNAPSIRNYVIGIACLNLTPTEPQKVLDGLFLHAKRPKEADRFSVDPGWFIDCAHALACLQVYHAKFVLMTARNARCVIKSSPIPTRLKLIYALSSIPKNTVESLPADVRESWEHKVPPTIRAVADSLRTERVDLLMGSLAAGALKAAGIVEHPLIPDLEKCRNGESPMDAVLRSWSVAPRERIMELSTALPPVGAQDRPQSIADVFSMLASQCQPPEKDLIFIGRLEQLGQVVLSHIDSLEVDDFVKILDSVAKLKLQDNFSAVAAALCERLYAARKDILNTSKRAPIARILEEYGHQPTAILLLDYLASHP